MTDDQYYLVEKIIAKKIVNGEVRYRIKWKGFGKKHNSWEPIGNIRRVKSVAKFKSKCKTAKTIKQGSAKPPSPSKQVSDFSGFPLEHADDEDSDETSGPLLLERSQKKNKAL